MFAKVVKELKEVLGTDLIVNDGINRYSECFIGRVRSDADVKHLLPVIRKANKKKMEDIQVCSFTSNKYTTQYRLSYRGRKAKRGRSYSNVHQGNLKVKDALFKDIYLYEEFRYI